VCVTVCYCVLNCVTMCYSVLQCVAACCSVLQYVAECCSLHMGWRIFDIASMFQEVCVLQSVAEYCKVLQYVAEKFRYCFDVSGGVRVAVCCSVLQGVAACCSVLQRVAVCCSVLQYDAVCCSSNMGWRGPIFLPCIGGVRVAECCRVL